MATLNSKNSSIVYLNNRMAAFFLGEITNENTNATQYTFYTDAGKTDVKYSLNLNPAVGQRCLQYRCFSATSYLPTFCPYVLYTPQNTIDVLYQTNFVTAQASNHGTILCTFWSTLKEEASAKQNGGKSIYVVEGKITKGQHLSYDAATIEKINQQAYTSGVILSGKRNCIFCMAQIILQPLYIETTDGFTKQDVAVIKKKPVVLQQFESKHHMIDFCSGGGGSGGAGSGLAQHNHIPHVDGSGFAFAVFHPGTSMPQLPWN